MPAHQGIWESRRAGSAQAGVLKDIEIVGFHDAASVELVHLGQGFRLASRRAAVGADLIASRIRAMVQDEQPGPTGGRNLAQLLRGSRGNVRARAMRIIDGFYGPTHLSSAGVLIDCAASQSTDMSRQQRLR
jgi:hypothetical protein